MRIRFWVLMPGVRKRLKTAGHQTRKISRLRAGSPRSRAHEVELHGRARGEDAM
jgi:hypothetical protein